MSDLKDKDEFLTTEKKWDLSTLVKNLLKEVVPACVVRIEPLSSKKGMLEERGAWIRWFWNEDTTVLPNILGHRLMWSGLLFVAPGMKADEFKNGIVGILGNRVRKELVNLAIFSEVRSGSVVEEVDRMELQLSKLNYWDKHNYKSIFENGVEKELKT